MSDIPNDSSSAEEFYQHVKLPAENVVERRTGPVPEDVPAAEYLPSGPALFEEVDEIFFNYEDQINYDVREGGAAISNLAVSPLLSDFPQPQSVYSRTEENEQTNNDVTGTGRDLEEDAVPSESSPQEMKAVAPMKVFAERGTVKDSDDESLTDEYSDHQPQSVFSGTVEPDNENTDVTEAHAPDGVANSVEQDSATNVTHKGSPTLSDPEENAVPSVSSPQEVVHQLPPVFARSEAANTSIEKSPSSGAYKAPKSFPVNAPCSREEVVKLSTGHQSELNVYSERDAITPKAPIKDQPVISEEVRMKREKNKLAKRKSRAKENAKEKGLRKERNDLLSERTKLEYTVHQLQQDLEQLKVLFKSHDCKCDGE